MNIIERFANVLGRSKGHYLKGLDDVFSTTGSHPMISDDSAFMDLERWGEALLAGKEPKTKADFIRAFKGFVFICSKKNFQTVGSQRLRLYIAKKEKTKTYKTIETKPVSRQKKNWLYSRPHLDSYLRKAVEIEEITEHIFLDLMKSINPKHNQRDFKEYTTMYTDLTGECYWLMLKNNLGVPTQIWPIPSQYINPKFGKTLEKPIESFVYRHGATEVKIPFEDAIYFTFPNPENIFTGFSIVKGIANAVYIREQMEDFEKALFENKARIGGILSPSSGTNLTDKDRARLKEMFGQQYAGARKAGKLLIPPVDMKFEKDVFTPEEMNFIKGRAINMEEICLGFDIPPSIFDPKSNRATAYVGKENYAEGAILPRCERFSEKMNEKVLPLYDEKIFCEFDNPVPQDRDLILKEQIGRVKIGIMTINEARAEEGLEEIEGGDVAYIDNRLMPLGTEAEEEQIRQFTEKVMKSVKEVLG